jgi:hypothetical protein
MRTHNVTHWDPDNCYGCKIKTVQLAPQPFQPHYNYAVGAYVTSWADFNDKLKRLGEHEYNRTGISTSYVPVHPADLRSSPPPDSAPSNLPRLVAHDPDTHRPMHDPIDADPTLIPQPRSDEWNRQRAKALLESETNDLLTDPTDDDDAI